MVDNMDLKSIGSNPVGVRLSPRALIYNKMPKDKQMINNKFFKEWPSNMAYVLGFVVADGCVMKRKDRKDSFIFNITTKDREHLENIQKAMCSKYQIGLKSGGGSREREIFRLFR